MTGSWNLTQINAKQFKDLGIYITSNLSWSLQASKCASKANSVLGSQVAQARYMSSSMCTFALFRDSSDLHIYKDLYGERNKPEKKRKITVELQ